MGKLSTSERTPSGNGRSDQESKQSKKSKYERVPSASDSAYDPKNKEEKKISHESSPDKKIPLHCKEREYNNPNKVEIKYIDLSEEGIKGVKEPDYYNFYAEHSQSDSVSFRRINGIKTDNLNKKNEKL